MRFKHLPLLGAIALSAPSFAVTVNMTDFYFPGSALNVTYSGGPSGASSATVQAGEFSGTMTADALAASARFSSTQAAPEPTSFLAWCTELDQSFYFHTPYQYELDSAASYYHDGRATALSRLFTAGQGFVIDATTAAAFQAGIWEIVYEDGTAYDLRGGSFMASLQTTPGSTDAFNTVNGFLMHLGNYDASSRIDILASLDSQDFIVATPVPEPETWAMLMAGLGALGWAARRKAATQVRATA